MYTHTRIADWPEDDRPREKLIRLGPDSLSDAELLAIILRVGTKQRTAIDLAREILKNCNGFRGIARMDVEMLTDVPGIGIAKAAQIKAAIEIGNRLAAQASNGQQLRITCSKDAFDYLHLKYRDRKREVFCLLMLTSRNRVIDEKIIFEGSLTHSMVSTREVVRELINAGAAQVIFIHNHPSGEVTPSPEDLQITKQLVTACRAVDVQVLDHLIIGDNQYYSFADEGKL